MDYVKILASQTSAWFARLLIVSITIYASIAIQIVQHVLLNINAQQITTWRKVFVTDVQLVAANVLILPIVLHVMQVFN